MAIPRKNYAKGVFVLEGVLHLGAYVVGVFELVCGAQTVLYIGFVFFIPFVMGNDI